MVDQAGTAVPGATVTVSAVATNRTRTTVTNAAGGYVFAGLAPGEYRVRVEIAGFRPVAREGVRMVTGETIRLDLRLEIGVVTEAITVNADASLLRSESSGLGHVTDSRRIVDLPLSPNLLNELRIGDTRRAVERAASRLEGTPSSVLGLPGIPSTAQFPDTLPTFLIGGYQQLGSPSNTASDFGTSVTQIADSLTWLKGRHTLKMGAGHHRRRSPGHSTGAEVHLLGIMSRGPGQSPGKK